MGLIAGMNLRLLLKFEIAHEGLYFAWESLIEVVRCSVIQRVSEVLA